MCGSGVQIGMMRIITKPRPMSIPKVLHRVVIGSCVVARGTAMRGSVACLSVSGSIQGTRATTTGCVFPFSSRKFLSRGRQATAHSRVALSEGRREKQEGKVAMQGI